MNSFTELLKHEIMAQNRIHHILRHNVQFISFSLVCLIFLCPARENIAEFGLIFLIISLPLATIGITRDIVKADIYDGSLEILMITTTTLHIVLIKFLALLLNNIAALIIAMPFIVIFYTLSFEQAMLSIANCIMLLIQISAMSLFIGCIEGYFRSNTDLISSILLPIMIPGIIVSGLLLHATYDLSLYINILLGINLIVTPIILILSGYLLRNIYNTISHC